MLIAQTNCTTLLGVYGEERVHASAVFDKPDADLAKQLVPTSLTKLCRPMSEDWVAYWRAGAAGREGNRVEGSRHVLVVGCVFSVSFLMSIPVMLVALVAACY